MDPRALQEPPAPPVFRIHRYPAGLIDRLNLPGNRAVVLRPVLPQDAEAEQAFVGGLSLASRHKRFHVGLRQLSAATLRQMTEIDYRDHVALVAQVFDENHPPDAEPPIVADARYVRLAGTDEAEFAVAVADDWQSLGLGRALMARLARHAKAQGLAALVGDVLPENRRMLVLMRGLGAHTRPHPDGPQMVQVVYRLL
ncbi:GNAT family N-acetyltransferase [Ideonella sp.]|uniref:GNAT family N-acetyltransferase n=1 Tax=Ideonella sp. TaxID=1929293 RepID=UPI002B488245|nr:GNAT family N-acetyltransferase [Ideonella sp.]HJV68721.1 GNAT family N-acetyltransferase [Ideonella sp.]